MTFPRLARRYPALDRLPAEHSYRVIFDTVSDLEVTWTQGGSVGTVTRRSGLSLIGLVRTKTTVT